MRGVPYCSARSCSPRKNRSNAHRGYSQLSFNWVFLCSLNSDPTSPSFRCEVAVEYCCKWDWEQNQQIIMIQRVWSRFASDDDCWSNLTFDCFTEFERQLNNVIIAHASNQQICRGECPPCGDNRFPPNCNIVLTRDRCMKFYRYRSGGQTYSGFVPCRDQVNTCYQRICCCTDYSAQPPRLVSYVEESGTIGEPACTLHWYDVFETTYRHVNWYGVTPCFYTECP